MGVRGIELPTTLDSVINMPAFYYAVSRGTDLISYIRWYFIRKFSIFG